MSDNKEPVMTGLAAWLPTEPMVFGVDRDPKVILPNGMVIRPDRSVNDVERRSWRERLFSRPWKPLKTYNECARIYIIGNDAICSWKTFNKLNCELKARNE